jgi:hypothetical protein
VGDRVGFDRVPVTAERLVAYLGVVILVGLLSSSTVVGIAVARDAVVIPVRRGDSRAVRLLSTAARSTSSGAPRDPDRPMGLAAGTEVTVVYLGGSSAWVRFPSGPVLETDAHPTAGRGCWHGARRPRQRHLRDPNRHRVGMSWRRAGGCNPSQRTAGAGPTRCWPLRGHWAPSALVSPVASSGRALLAGSSAPGWAPWSGSWRRERRRHRAAHA